MHEWYYSQGNQQLGPVSWEQLVELAASGQLAATDLVWKHPMPNWLPASGVAGLMPAPPSAPPAYGAPSYGMPSTSGSPAAHSAPSAGDYAPPYDPGNPYAAPQAPLSASGANVSGWLTQMTVVSILMMVQGGLECLFSAMYPLVGFGQQQQANATPVAVFWALGGAVLIGGLLKLIGGVMCFRFRARPVGFVALATSVFSLCTCYCIPTALALSIYGLIVLLNEHVAAAFALGAQGLSREEIISRFR